MKFLKLTVIIITVLSIILFSLRQIYWVQNSNAERTEIITKDISNFWYAFDQSRGGLVNPIVLDSIYLLKGTDGLKGYMNYRIQSAEHLAKVVNGYIEYYKSARPSTERIEDYNSVIMEYLKRFKDVYPEAVFPPIHFVIGAMNSGGSTSIDGIIIGAEMYGLTPETPTDKLSEWHKSVLKPVEEIPVIVVHELVHVQQNRNLLNLFSESHLLSVSIEEGAADFISELVTGKHINTKLHDYANPMEEELWIEFEKGMHSKNYQNWFSQPKEGKPNDLGYWMGYKIVESYYINRTDKKKAIDEIINVADYDEFLKESEYAAKFIR